MLARLLSCANQTQQLAIAFGDSLAQIQINPLIEGNSVSIAPYLSISSYAR